MNRSRTRRLKLKFAATCVALAAMSTGCVRRTVTITSDPPGALVFLNDQEVGRTEMSTDFVWYGEYDVVLRKEGYETLETGWKPRAPWYQFAPLDFFCEVLYPGKLHDQHFVHYALSTKVVPSPEDVADRAIELRENSTTPTKP